MIANKAWPIVPLGTVVSHRKEFVRIDDTKVYKRCRVQLHAKGVVLRDEVEGARIKTKQQQVCAADELLVAEIDAKVGGFGIIPPALERAIVSSHYFLFTPDRDRIHPAYLGYYVKTHLFRDQVNAQGSTNYAAIRPQHVLGYEIPLPPLDEQRRIVAKIEHLAAKIDEAQGLHGVSTTECQYFWPSFLGREFRSLADSSPLMPLQELSATITDGPHKTPQYLQDGIPFVTVQNMVTGKLNFTGLKYISKEDHAEFSKRCKPECGDVLYSKDGATRGNPCFVDTDREFNIFVSVALIKPQRDALDGRYLCYVLQSQWLRDRMLQRSRGDMIPHIVLREIRRFPIPAVPLEEQRRIVDYLDGLHTKIDQLKHLQAQTSAELDALLPSILDRAFKGEL